MLDEFLSSWTPDAAWSPSSIIPFDPLRRLPLPELMDRYAAVPERVRQTLALLGYNHRNRLIDELGHEGKNRPDLALDMLEDLLREDLLTYQYACQTIGQIGADGLAKAETLLRTIAGHDYPKAREFAAEAFAAILAADPSRAAQPLESWAYSGDVRLRETAARTLGFLDIPYTFDTVEILAHLASDEFSDVRRQTAFAIRFYLKQPYPEALEIAVGLSYDNRWETGQIAIESLGHAGPFFALGALKVLRHHINRNVPPLGAAAAQAMAALSARHPKRTLAFYRCIAEDRSWVDGSVLHLIVDSLLRVGQTRPEEALNVLRHLATDEDEHLRDRAVEAMQLLSQPPRVAEGG